MTYVTPLQDFRFAHKELAGLDEILKLPSFEEISVDLVDAILEENGRFVEQAIAPLNVPGDTQPPVWEDGAVSTSPDYTSKGFVITPQGWAARAAISRGIGRAGSTQAGGGGAKRKYSNSEFGIFLMSYVD